MMMVNLLASRLTAISIQISIPRVVIETPPARREMHRYYSLTSHCGCCRQHCEEHTAVLIVRQVLHQGTAIARDVIVLLHWYCSRRHDWCITEKKKRKSDDEYCRKTSKCKTPQKKRVPRRPSLFTRYNTSSQISFHGPPSDSHN